MPLPTETLLRVQVSPVPTQTLLWLLGSIVMAPIDCTGWSSKTGLKVVAPSVDFHTPPLAEPTNRVTLPEASVAPARAEMRPLMAAAPMLRAPSPEMTPESNTGASAAAAARLSPQSRAPLTVVTADRIDLISRWLLGRGCAGMRHRETERVLIHGHIGFGLLELDLLAIARALRSRFLSESEVDSIHLLVVAIVGDRLAGHAVLDAPLDGADLQEVVRIQVDVEDVSVRPRHTQLVRERAVHILGPEIVELVALGLVVHEGTGEVGGVLAQALRVIVGKLLRVLASLKGIDLPGLASVVRLHPRETLKGGLVADRSPSADERRIADLECAIVDEQLPRQA